VNATAGGIPRVVMAGVPAMTMREIRLGMKDQDGGRHWSRGQCWCRARHQVDGDELVMVPPPWDETRGGEMAR
jgi:hypothetical protein